MCDDSSVRIECMSGEIEALEDEVDTLNHDLEEARLKLKEVRTAAEKIIDGYNDLLTQEQIDQMERLYRDEFGLIDVM